MHNHSKSTTQPGKMSFMTRLRASHMFQTLLRALQFLSAAISLGLFSARLAKIVRLVGRASTSNGAVEGILAAAVAYTLTMMLLRFCVKGRSASILRWVMVVLDILFVGGFIAVAYLTRPHGGSSGPCRKTLLQPVIPKGYNCNLPWGTFILAILSTVLHALTAIFHEVKDHHHNNKNMDHHKHKQQQYELEHGNANDSEYSNGNNYQNGGGYQNENSHQNGVANGNDSGRRAY